MNTTFINRFMIELTNDQIKKYVTQMNKICEDAGLEVFKYYY